ncbi:GNAT family N-acetyltransferase [Roseomonas fluvialis]|uniref:N-acetyltransferase n=1 Tax=Roseomonas fluvialis TaxID=1750527 RepID=A0ABM7Y726_9PROT|nr:GNAT family N-acetyltransferase [Roseomonas fluvialis]BDG73814.1 N-acetyltransferase [Roseomonas fluvialis]
MTDVVGIRPARPTDFDAWLPLWEGYNAFYERTGPTAVSEAQTRTTWARFFDGHEPMEAIVAEQAAALVGFVHIIFHRNTTMMGPTCYLQDLFAAPSLRGRGVGRALIEAAAARAKEAGATRLYWQTQEGNATARLLYDRIAQRSGFIVYRMDLA